MIFLLSGRDRKSLEILSKQFKQLKIQFASILFLHFQDYSEQQKNEISDLLKINDIVDVEFCHLHSGWKLENANKIKNNKFIFLDGGLVKKWEYFSRTRRLDRLINPEIQTIVAVSGSAILMGLSLLTAIEYGTPIDDNFKQGLGLVDADIFPHGQRFLEKDLHNYLIKNNRSSIIRLCDGGIVIVRNKEMIYSENAQLLKNNEYGFP